MTEFDDRLDAFLGHGTGPLQHGLHVDQLRPVPVLLQDSPAAFDRIVFAVIRGVVEQLDGRADGVRKVDQAMEKLGASPMAFWAIVSFDLEQGEGLAFGQREPLPPGFEAVDEEIAGLGGGSEPHGQLSGVLLQEAKGRVFFSTAHLMVDRPRPAAGFASPRIGANIDGRFAIDTHPFDSAVCDGLGVFFPEIGEDRVRLGDFFWGLALTTGRSR